MRILQDGTVEIRNKKTGATKIVSPQDLPNYGIPYSKFETELKAFKGIGGETETEIKEEPSEAEAKRARGLSDAERIVTLLEEKYFGSNQGKGIGYGKAGGISKNLELATAFGENISPELEDISSYRALRDSARPAFARAMGDVGNLSEPEQTAAIKNIPDIFQTKGQALKYFKDVRQKLGLSEKNYGETENQPLNLTQALANGGLSMGNGSQPQQPQMTQQANPLMDFLQRGQQGAERARNPGEANWLGKMFFPRGAAIQSAQSQGQPVSMDERIGAGGEALSNILPFVPGLGQIGLAGKLGLAGVSRGVTEPGADVGERLKGGAIQGVVGAGLGKGGQLMNTLLRPGKVLGGQRKQITEVLEKTGVKVGDNPETVNIAKKMIKEDLAGPKFQPIIKELAKGKGASPTSVLDLLVRAGKKTFTGGGEKRLADQAEYYDLLREGIRADFTKKAPEVIKLTTQMGKILGGWKNLRKGTIVTGSAAGAIGGGAYLFNLLRGKGGGQ